jgi:hypothetical protein
MNKSSDERLLKPGEYVDALNIRVSSDEDGQAGSVENAKGNIKLTTLSYLGSDIPTNSRCIGAYEDGANEKIYWFITSSVVDMIVSYDTKEDSVVYHVVSTSVLNFSEYHLINGINLIDDLLFFTDNYNQPRRINVKKSYKDPVNGVDQITEDDISVIVKPPKEAPNLTLVVRATKENYIEDKFIRFAYRYRYSDGEYSALSEFSDVAFLPGQFRLDISNNDMVGMRNLANRVEVEFNTGNKDVIGIDLCYKLSNSSIINVIERFNKEEKEWGDLNDVSISFDNQKIYTTLTESELLRTYDNVPKLAKTQTAIGNRIMYANYVDGHDVDTVMDYSMDLVSEEIGFDEITEDEDSGTTYTIDTSKTVTDARLLIDLDGIDMKEGGSLFIDLNILHDSFGGDSSYAGGPENSYQEPFQYIFPRDYDDAQDLATDPDFISSIQSDELFADSNDGYSLTDLFFSSIQSKSGWSAVGGGITSDTGDFSVTVSGSVIGLQSPAIKYELDSTPGTFAYEYFLMSSTTVSVNQLGNRESLHSNRDYELGMVYLDEYNRASTALVCNENTLYVPPENSITKNSIKATVNHLAPSWASRYRFVLKPSKGGYETIYSYIYFYSPEESAWWLLLEGDNQTKAKVGDRLIVKTSTSGPTSDVIKTKVLEIKAQERDFIPDVTSPPGLYMKIKASGFALNSDENAVIDYGTISSKNQDVIYGTTIPNPDFDETQDVSSSNKRRIEYDIPAGSLVQIKFSGQRSGKYSQIFKFDRVFTARTDYDNFYDFIIGEKINFNNPTNSPNIESDSSTPDALWIESIGNTSTDMGRSLQSVDWGYIYPEGQWVIIFNPAQIYGTTQVRYYRDQNTGAAFLGFAGAGQSRRGKNYYTKAEIIVSRAGDVLSFETEPNEIDSETYYETSKSFPIENRYHLGGSTDQSELGPAIINVNAFNCYAFGNGVESFKINDGLAEPGFNIGARVTAVSKQDYKETRRYADITYSGVYNEESNVNKLNEFNLALVNWKTLENAFGPIEKIHARQNDILVLQEDKISTVLTGKNLLSDAAGGGAITSSLEVLGTQVSRLDEYGISNDPESFASYGSDVYFSDSKRGSILNISGDKLSVISDLGMGSWFRDKFISTKNNLKIGGYDPYTKEYVFSITDHVKEVDGMKVPCNTKIGQDYENTGNNNSEAYTYTVQFEESIGEVPIRYSGYTEPSGVDFNPGFTIQVSYNGSEVINQFISTLPSVSSGQVVFTKDNLDVNECTVTITPRHTNYSVEVGCAQEQTITVFRISRNDTDVSGLSVHQDYYWSKDGFTSNKFTDYIQFTDGPSSFYETFSNTAGVGFIPDNDSQVTMRFVPIYQDTATYNSYEFKYLVSDVLYSQAEVETLAPLLQTATPVVSQEDDIHYASFTYSNPLSKPYLYLVWDYVS